MGSTCVLINKDLRHETNIKVLIHWEKVSLLIENKIIYLEIENQKEWDTLIK